MDKETIEILQNLVDKLEKLSGSSQKPSREEFAMNLRKSHLILELESLADELEYLSDIARDAGDTEYGNELHNLCVDAKFAIVDDSKTTSDLDTLAYELTADLKNARMKLREIDPEQVERRRENEIHEKRMNGTLLKDRKYQYLNGGFKSGMEKQSMKTEYEKYLHTHKAVGSPSVPMSQIEWLNNN